MPVHYNDGLDDQLAYDLTGSFVGGQVSHMRANLLSATQFSESENMDIDKFGAIITRRGTVIVGATLTNPIRGLAFMDTPTTEQLLTVSNGVLYKSTGSTFSSVSGYTPATANDVNFAQLIDKVYMTDNSVNVYSYNGTAVTDEGTTSSDPPKCKFIATHTNRIFAANTENFNDEVAASDLLDGGTWASSFQFRVGGGEGDPITGIVSWYNFNLLVFKTRSIHVVSTTPTESTAANWQVHRIDNTVGCVGHRTIAQAGPDVFFLARDGIRTVRTILAGAQSSVSEPISIPIDDIIGRINWGYASKCCATFWDNKYMLSVPLDSSTTNNYTIIYNTVSRSWSGYWTGWTPNAFCVSSFSDNPKMVFGDSSGNVLTWQDFVEEASESDASYQDNGVSYESMMMSRGHVFGDYMSTKLGNHIEIELETSTVGCHCVDLLATTDEGNKLRDSMLASNISNDSTGVPLPVDLDFTLPEIGIFSKSYNLTNQGEFGEIKFKVKSESGKLHLRSIKASAYMNTMPLEK